LSTPQSLAGLLAWYRSEVDAAIPQRIHAKAIDAGGAPEWHGAFRVYLTAHPAQEDHEGNLVSPLRFWLWRMGGKRARYLHALAFVEFDWIMASALRGIHDADAAHDYTRTCLKRLHVLMYAPDGTPTEPRRATTGDCAEQGCSRRTTHLRCPEHEAKT
jgi:hypothetical protein